jgi:hypothetical protein
VSCGGYCPTIPGPPVDLLAVHRTGGKPGAVKPPPPGGVPSAENITGFEKGVVIAAFTLQALDGVLKLRNNAPTEQTEHVYLRVFDKLYEVPISSIGECHGRLQDDACRMCLMNGFFTRERTDAYPTLPSCPPQSKKDVVVPRSQAGRG